MLEAIGRLGRLFYLTYVRRKLIMYVMRTHTHTLFLVCWGIADERPERPEAFFA